MIINKVIKSCYELRRYNDYLTKRFYYLRNKIISQKIGVILTLHHVINSIDEINSRITPLYITDRFLEEIIRNFKKRGYSFISIDELIFGICKNKYIKNNKLVVVTMDDGYKDVYKNAYPIFKYYKVPFTLYVAASFPDKKAILWWHIIDKIINEEGECCKKGSLLYKYHKKILKHGINQKIALELLLKNILSKRENIDIYCEEYNAELNKSMLIDWDDIKEMNRDPLCTIGSHGYWHFGLRYAPTYQVYRDMLVSKRILERKLNIRVDHYAYPYGTPYSVGPREFKLALMAGYKTAVTNGKEYLYQSDFKKLFCLPRYMLFENDPIMSIF